MGLQLFRRWLEAAADTGAGSNRALAKLKGCACARARDTTLSSGVPTLLADGRVNYMTTTLHTSPNCERMRDLVLVASGAGRVPFAPCTPWGLCAICTLHTLGTVCHLHPAHPGDHLHPAHPGDCVCEPPVAHKNTAQVVVRVTEL